MNLCQCFLHIFTHLYRITTRLLCHNQSDCLASICTLIQRQVFDRIAHCSYIADEYLLTKWRHCYHQILNLTTLHKLRANLHLVLLFVHLYSTRREVEVISRDHLSHLLQTNTIGIQFLLVDIHIHIAVWCSCYREVTNTINLVQLWYYFVVQNLIQRSIRLICCNSVLADRHGAG